jgi:hypothetical protein
VNAIWSRPRCSPSAREPDPMSSHAPKVFIRAADEAWDVGFVGADEQDHGFEVQFGVAGCSPSGCEEVVLAAPLADLFVGAAGAVVFDHHGCPAPARISAAERRVRREPPGAGRLDMDHPTVETRRS